MWTGLMLGTALAVLAMMNGVRLRVGGVPSFLGWMLGGLLVWLLVVAAATAVAEVLRRHHRAIGRYAGRQAGRGARHGLRLARRHGSRGLHAAGGWADGRWRARQAGPQPAQVREPVDLGAALRPSRWLPGRRRAADTEAMSDPNPTPADGFPAVPPATAEAGTGGGGWGDPDPAGDYGAGPWVLGVRRRDGQPYYDGPDGPQVATTFVPTPDDLRRRLNVAATDPDTEVRVAPAKVTDPELIPPALHPAASRPTDPAGIPLAVTENQHGGTDMSTAADTYYPPGYDAAPPASGLPRRTARTAAAPEPNGVWRSLISSTNGFEPENDGHLLSWMAGEAGGMSGYAEEIADVYETAVNTIGLDPVAMAALHDYADAAATAAEAMARARQRFADHYSEVRQFAASGGVLPYNGRWMTGEGD